jgi:hypothetical protein
VNANNPNIVIAGGTFTSSNYVAPSVMSGAMGILSTGLHTVVTNFTVLGKAKHEVTGSGYRNIQLNGGGGSSINNCTANEMQVSP